jgi:hypothetical protein
MYDQWPRSRPCASISLRPDRPQRDAEPGALQTSCPARSLALVPVASSMVLPGIPDGFPETAHSVHAQRSRVKETDSIPAADEGNRAHPPTPTDPPLGRRPPALPASPFRRVSKGKHHLLDGIGRRRPRWGRGVFGRTPPRTAGASALPQRGPPMRRPPHPPALPLHSARFSDQKGNRTQNSRVAGARDLEPTQGGVGTHEEPGTLTQGAPVFPGSSRLGIQYSVFSNSCPGI